MTPPLVERSVLDRLLGGKSHVSRSDARASVNELRQMVRRDLEWLLNSRCLLDLDSERYHEIGTSILGYGLPDLSGGSRSTTFDRQRIADLLREVIRTFEPRLLRSSVQVEVLPTSGDALRLHFGVHAILQVDPVREPVYFDTVIEPDGSGVRVEAPA